VFWCPINGVATSGSTYPRSELREQVSPGDNTVNWRVGDFAVSSLDVTLNVNQIPPNTGDIGIGQIHEYGGSDKPFVLLHYTNGLIHAKVLTQECDGTCGAPYDDLVFSSVPLDAGFSYTLKTTSDGNLHVVVNGAEQTMAIDSSWLSAGLYFKAGTYCLDNGSSSVQGCQASFYALSVMHGSPVDGGGMSDGGGSPDSGSADGGGSSDSGGADGGVVPDGGEASTGCGCSGTAAGAAWTLPALLLPVGRYRARKRH
jgi:uncharacterized membrane protein YgcG